MKKIFIIALILLGLTGIANADSFNYGASLSVSGGTVSGNVTITGNLAVTGNTTDSSLNASSPVFTDASKNLTSAGTVPLNQGGTGATTMVGAQQALGLTYTVVDNSANQTLPAATAGLRRVYSTEANAVQLNIAPASGEKIQFGRTLGAADQVLRGDSLAYSTAYCECVTAGQWNCYDNSGVFAFVP